MPPEAAANRRRGVYPGSFNPPTVAHLAVSEAARREHRLDVVVWTVSRVALAKESVARPRLADRMAVLAEVAEGFDWLEAALVDAQLLSDIAAGFDVVIMGADKWHQIHDVAFYDGDPDRRDASIAALPTVAVAPRPPHETPPELALELAPEVAAISSTDARQGDRAAMLDAAARFDAATGAWTDPARYDRRRQTQPDG
ncbi:MAG TPA: hypothetical protein DEP66_03135 [Acidimicrobiaceae bacterium]|nr:hypothetical protein [Acidimicrobiaceae bacterium]